MPITFFQSVAQKHGHEKFVALANHYSEVNNRITVTWLEDTTKIGGKIPEGFRIVKNEHGQALAVGPLAVTKMATEATFLRAMIVASDAFGSITDEDAWKKIAQLHRADGNLDERSLALIKYQNPSFSNEEMMGLIRKFEDLIALDTVRNEYMLHPRLYSWMSSKSLRNDLDNFNELVYKDLFLTPSSDPWLGLLSLDVYTAIDNGGVIKR